MQQSWHVLVEGRSMHAAGYGHWVERIARGKGLSGWVEARGDGAIEMALHGDRTAVGSVLASLRTESSHGQVDRVTSWVSDDRPEEGFQVRSSASSTEAKTNRPTHLRLRGLSAGPESRAKTVIGALSRKTKKTAAKTSPEPSISTSPETEISDLVERAAVLDREVESALANYVAPSRLKRRSKSERDAVRRALRGATPFQVSYMTLRRLERARMSVGRGASFQAKMVESSEARRLGRQKSIWRLDDKARAYHLIDRLGVPRPESSATATSFGAIEPQYPSVVKNTRGTGSRGCYLVYGANHIVHLYDHMALGSWKEMALHADSLMDAHGRGHVLRDSWLVEELILDPDDPERGAPDVKCYTFYGETKIVLEMRRDRGREYSFATADNVPLDSGIDVKTYQGDGVTPEEVDLIRRIGLSIPYPFVRIDMLRGPQGLVFGEFTPRTGSFDEFSPEMDRMLGEAWLEAESRLWEDLVRGKRFEAFTEATGIA